MKMNKNRKFAAALLSSWGVVSASSQLLFAADPTDPSLAPATPTNVNANAGALPAQLAAKTALSPEITVLPAGDQANLQQSLSDLKNKYGDDLMNRLIFKYENGQLKVVGVNENVDDIESTKPSSF